MKTEKSLLEFYREKISEVHTSEEIKDAFEHSFAVCILKKPSEKTSPSCKTKLFAEIWKLNPDVMIKEVDLCVIHTSSEVLRNQFLIINKNGTKEISSEIVRLIESSEYTQSAYCFYSEKKNGIKGCYRRVFGSDKPAVIDKANLLIDGDNLLVTVRTMAPKKNRAELYLHTKMS